jgi:hypothetical protein
MTANSACPDRHGCCSNPLTSANKAILLLHNHCFYCYFYCFPCCCCCCMHSRFGQDDCAVLLHGPVQPADQVTHAALSHQAHLVTAAAAAAANWSVLESKLLG